MLLSVYQARTRQLLQNPGAPVSLYSDADITTFVNIARSQIAGEQGCIPAIGTIDTVANQDTYDLGNITYSTASGIGDVLTINQIWNTYGGNSGYRIESRSWPYFSLYSHLNNPASQPGMPTMYAQFGKGINTVFYLDPTPDSIYTLSIDVTCNVADLVSDVSPDAISYPWTDCVSFLAAYYAMLSAQSAVRQADADRMYQRYMLFAKRAREMSDSNILRDQFEYESDLTLANKLGLNPRSQAQEG